MKKSSKQLDRVEEAKEILTALGLPTAQRNEISAYTLLALLNIGPNDPWYKADRRRCGVSKEIMAFITEKYKKTYAPNTRETVRRQVLHQFHQARIVDYNPFEPDLPTNSPRAHYAISEPALDAIKTFGSRKWKKSAEAFVKKYGSLAESYARHRSQGNVVPVKLLDGSKVKLSPGKHNTVQKAVIEDFAPRFAPGATLLYLGDTAKKNVVMEVAELATLGLGTSDHDKLPDIILYDKKKKWLFLIEAVTSHGPMSPKRLKELEMLLIDSQVGVVYVSAFPDMAEFRKHMKDIAWETEVWLVDTPDHLIHFNGDRFLGPRN